MISSATQSLLLVEDSDEDFEAICRILKRLSVLNPIFRALDGDEALDFLQHTGKYHEISIAPRPSLILLDLNLPGTDGREVLEQIKQDTDLRTIPVVVLTTSSNPIDVERCYQNGVNSYILKPINLDRLVDTLKTFIHYWFEITCLPDSPDRIP